MNFDLSAFTPLAIFSVDCVSVNPNIKAPKVRKQHENPTRNFLSLVQPSDSTLDNVDASKHIPGIKHEIFKCHAKRNWQSYG